MESITYRKLNKDDVHEIQRLLKELQDYHYENRPDIFLAHIVNIEQVLDFMLNNYTIYGAENSKQSLVGFIAFNIIDVQLDSFTVKAKKLVIHDLIVTREMRNKGIATELMSICKNIAKENNMSLELGVWGFNKRAIRFYRKQGFNYKTIDMECNIL